MTQVKTNKGVAVRLAVMMFMQYLMFAVWWVPLAAYLTNMGFSESASSWILSSMAIGCIASPIIGMVADRYFASEKVLAVSNALTAILLYFAAGQTEPVLLFILLMLAMICYMPSWGLTSAIAMAHLPAEQFPRIRLFGSIGWVASALFSLVAVKYFGLPKFDGTVLPLYCAAGAGVVTALLNLTLPKTPPAGKGQPISVIDALGLRMFTLMKDKNFAVFTILSFLAMIPWSLYFSYASQFLSSQGFELITATMNMGQVAEMLFLIGTTWIIAKAGIKYAMAIGLVALVIRFASFQFGVILNQEWMYMIGILVHGLIFGLFMVGGQIYVNEKAPVALRAQGQGYVALITNGLGMLAGTLINGFLIEKFKVVSAEGLATYDWSSIMGISTGLSVVILIAFLVLFKEK